MYPFEVSQRDLYDNNPWQIMNQLQHSTPDSAISSDNQQNSNSVRENSQYSQDVGFQNSQSPSKKFYQHYLQSGPFFRRNQTNENRLLQNNLSRQIKNEKELSLLENTYENVNDISKFLSLKFDNLFKTINQSIETQQKNSDALLKIQNVFEEFNVKFSKTQQQLDNENKVMLALQKSLQEKEIKIGKLESKILLLEKQQDAEILKSAEALLSDIDKLIKTNLRQMQNLTEKASETTNKTLVSSLSKHTNLLQNSLFTFTKKLEEMESRNTEKLLKLVDNHSSAKYRREEENDSRIRSAGFQNQTMIPRFPSVACSLQTPNRRKIPDTSSLLIDQLEMNESSSKKRSKPESDMMYFFSANNNNNNQNDVNHEFVYPQSVRSNESSPSISVSNMLLDSADALKNEVYLHFTNRENSSQRLRPNDSGCFYRRRSVCHQSLPFQSNVRGTHQQFTDRLQKRNLYTKPVFKSNIF